MPGRTSTAMTPAGPYCSIERTVAIIGERWTFLILREALMNRITRFADFERALAISPNILTDRLAGIVDAGILEKRPYQDPGSRPRFSYHPTAAGEQLRLVLAALQQWGDDNIPPEGGVTVARRTVEGDLPVRVGFVDDEDQPHPLAEVTFARTAAYPVSA